jgi:hypothetical protein
MTVMGTRKSSEGVRGRLRSVKGNVNDFTGGGAHFTDMSSLLDQALLQVEHVKSFCNFTIVLNIEDQERRPPAHLVDVRSGPTLRPDPLLRRTFDPEIWHGLGVVGLWAAIDAFRERKGKKAGQMAPGSLACSPRFAAARRLGRGG